MSNRLQGDHFRGCLLGGAVGDALGAPIEFLTIAEIRSRFGPAGLQDYAPAYDRLGAITDDTQMTIFTAEGILRAYNRWRVKGICNASAVLFHAYLRWLITQGERPHDADLLGLDTGWVIRVPELYAKRAPGNTCLSALREPEWGTVEEPRNDSKGCGGVMRVAPIGLLYAAIELDVESAFGMGRDAAAVTHGHPTRYLPAGFLAVLIYYIVRGGELEDAVSRSLHVLAKSDSHAETTAAVTRAMDLAKKHPDPSPERVEELGGGWVAEEALAIALYCSVTARGDFRKGVLAAVNHGGDSDSTGAITGNLLGALSGVSAIPSAWLDQLELRGVLETLADDLLIGHSETEQWQNSYPGV